MLYLSRASAYAVAMSTPEVGDLDHADAGRRPSAAQRAYTFVKDRIVTGGYAGGTLLSEGEVAGAVRVSRTPVREAMLRLETEGLLRLYPKRGALVVPVSADEIADVLDARAVVEPHAARRVIDSGRHEEVAADMRAVLSEQRALDSSTAGRFTELDRRFHHILVAAAGNRLLTGFYATLRDRQLRMGTAALLRDPRRLAEILDEHATLCRHLAAGDREALGAAVVAHIAATRAALDGR